MFIELGLGIINQVSFLCCRCNSFLHHMSFCMFQCIDVSDKTIVLHCYVNIYKLYNFKSFIYFCWYLIT